MPSSTSTIGVAPPIFTLVERFGHLRRPRGEQVLVRREEFHDDRLGRAGKVADHVLENLDEFHIENRF